MNITKHVITDLLPLYVANECSADTRAIVEDYLQRHPAEAEELRRILRTPPPGGTPPARDLDEMRAFRKARQIVRRRSWLLAFAIFFTLAPFSFIFSNGQIHWMLRDAPMSALAYSAVAAVLWIAYAVARHRSLGL